MKYKTILELFNNLPDEERIMVDVLRQIILSAYPGYIKEKISYNVPFFYATKGIAIVWPATVPRGGIKSGVLLGFWYGNKIIDEDNFLTHGTNKQIFYKIYQHSDQIDDRPVLKLLKEAMKLDQSFKRSKQKNEQISEYH